LEIESSNSKIKIENQLSKILSLEFENHHLQQQLTDKNSLDSSIKELLKNSVLLNAQLEHSVSSYEVLNKIYLKNCEMFHEKNQINSSLIEKEKIEKAKLEYQSNRIF